MAKGVLRRCCGNCEWSISPECEEEIMIENDYDQSDIGIPRAGDCCLGLEHNGNYVCDSHEYISGLLENRSFYDDKYLGPGYFIVSLYGDKIVKFIKLYRTGNYDDYSYCIRVYECDSIKTEGNVGVSFEILKKEDDVFYNAITTFANVLDESVVWDIDGKSFMTSNVNEYSTILQFTGRNDCNYIDIKIDNNSNETIYKLFSYLFRNMGVTTMNMTNNEIYGKIRKITKKNNL